MDSDATLERMLEMIRDNSSCVLATADTNAVPHTSLMAYVPDGEGKVIYMITPQNTRKFRNLQENPNASLLIRDDSGNKALTLSCLVHVLSDPAEMERLKKRIVSLRPGLAELAALPDVAALKFEIKTLLLLDGPVASSIRELP
jgi:general stress protein 26